MKRETRTLTSTPRPDIIIYMKVTKKKKKLLGLTHTKSISIYSVIMFSLSKMPSAD